jgi:hypothetical protein
MKAPEITPALWRDLANELHASELTARTASQSERLCQHDRSLWFAQADRLTRAGIALRAAADQVEAQAAEITRLRALLERAGEVLRPFEIEAEEWAAATDLQDGDFFPLIKGPGQEPDEAAFSIGDLFRAYALAAEIAAALGGTDE